MEDRTNEILDKQFASSEKQRFPLSLFVFLGTVGLIVLAIIVGIVEDKVAPVEGLGMLGPLLMGGISLLSLLGTLAGLININLKNGFDKNIVGLLGNGLVLASILAILILV